MVDWGGMVSCTVNGTGGILLMRSAWALALNVELQFLASVPQLGRTYILDIDLSSI